MPSPTFSVVERAARLSERYGDLDGAALLRVMITREFPGAIALVSSFGAEAAVLLHLVAEIDRSVPVLFIDTGKLFDETLRYRAELVARLGLRDVRTLAPQPAALAAADRDGTLWQRDADRCCALRKVEPLARALAGFDAWITGRKRYQGGERAALPTIEAADGRIKINPLSTWSPEQIDAAFAAWDLPRHPLLALGYLSIGCAPCTGPVRDGADRRAGRWPGLAKTECGIHRPLASAAP